MKRFLACGAVFVVTAVSSQAVWAFTDNEARQAINQLRQQLRVVTETTQQVNIQMSERIDLLELEISRLRAMVEELGGKPPGYSSTQGGAPVERANSVEEQDAFDGAVDLYRQGRVKDAAESLRAFLTLYPNSTLAPTAMFYLGSSQYASKDFRNSIKTLQDMVAKYPEHARAPDALLVVAGSQFELNDRAGTKTTLQQIVSKYGSSAAAQTAKQRLELF
ncbi:tol-pal system protein YbgF [Orrella marina]|uniref:Cell division coordinator CpoB n=1 Tax=Orrella marina TaxID=2163011 RepID=A0A2R4XKG1_9BURK|nr:tol-pal system protein YbgF [Orrella marina]AWB34302.1 tol-pal system protein YbgF [Orrella marina]